MNTNTLYLHNSDEWETPQDLFDDYDAMFDFDLDVCATPENAKCEKFFTKEDDGLTQKWGGLYGAIRLTLKSQSGCNEPPRRLPTESAIWLSCFSRRGLIHDGFTNTSIRKRQPFTSSKVA